MSYEKTNTDILPAVDNAEVVEVTEVLGRKIALPQNIQDHFKRQHESATRVRTDVHPEAISFEAEDKKFMGAVTPIITTIMQEDPEIKQLGISIDGLKYHANDQQFHVMSFYSNADAIRPEQLAAYSQRAVAGCNEILEGVASPYRLPNL